MSAIQVLTGKNHKRTVTAFDQRTAFTQGFRMLITPTSSPTIPDVISAAGVITLPNVYSVGRNALRVYIDGNLKPQAGVDFTEDSPSQITLDPAHVASLNPLTSVIWIEWNRFLPGARDQDLVDLANVTPDIEDAVLDTGTLRSAPATALNPLVTLGDLLQPNLPDRHAVTNTVIGSVGSVNHTFNIDFSALANPITPPNGFRYALCSFQLDADDVTGVASNQDVTVYAGAYTAAPASLAVNNSYVTNINSNWPTDTNLSNSGIIIIELNDPPSVTADLTVYVVHVAAPPPGVYNISLKAFVEGWIR